MSKSVYSLVLMDEVVEAVDKVAYKSGMSRSNLINRILAEYVSYTTPQMKMQNVFGEVDRIMNELSNFKVQEHASDSMLSVFSALMYKYNPTIRYCVELVKTNEETAGELKVMFRTQSRQLILYLDEFFKLWKRLEEAYIEDKFTGGVDSRMEDGRFLRKLKLPKGIQSLSTEELGQAIAAYIQNMDKIIKIYFSYLDNTSFALRQMEKSYAEYVKTSKILL